MTDWIKFVLVDLHDGRKTKIWAVMTTDGSECLGRIGWYSPWRRYAYVHKAVAADDQVILEWDCLRKIADFCERETHAHKMAGKAVHHIDGNTSNNDISNLQIVNIKENTK